MTTTFPVPLIGIAGYNRGLSACQRLAPLYPDDPDIIAVASDCEPVGDGGPMRVNLNDPNTVLGIMLDHIANNRQP